MPHPSRFTTLEQLARSDLAAAVRGDRQALHRLLELIHPEVLQLVRRELSCFRRLRGKLSQQDLVQDVEFAITQRIAAFEDRGEGSFGSWVSTIVRNRIRDLHDYWSASKRTGREMPIDDAGGAPSRGAPAPASREALREEAFARLRRALQRLSARERQIVELRMRSGTMAEVAREVGISIDAAYKRWSRAVVQLESIYRFFGGGSSDIAHL